MTGVLTYFHYSIATPFPLTWNSAPKDRVRGIDFESYSSKITFSFTTLLQCPQNESAGAQHPGYQRKRETAKKIRTKNKKERKERVIHVAPHPG